MIKTTGKHKNYELMEYVNDVNREHVEVLQELNVNGIMDTSYTYGNEWFTGDIGSYLYDPRGSVSGLTDEEGMLWQSYRYDPFGNIDFGKPDHNNIYAYNAENYNGNTEHQYLRARYYDTDTADFLTEDSYLGAVKDPLSLNRYNYVKSSPPNYTDPSGHWTNPLTAAKNAAQNAYDQLRAYVEQYISIDGNIVTISIGTGDNSLTTKIEMAEGLSATEICELAISFAIGAIIQHAQFFHILGPTTVIGGLPNKYILDFLAKIGAEDYLVEYFLNSQMYYLGKYASALFNIMVANTELSVSSPIMDKAKGLLNSSGQQQLDSTPELKQNQMGASAGILAGAALTNDTITALIAIGVAGISSLLGGIEIVVVIAGTVTTVLMAGENSAMGQAYLESSRDKIEEGGSEAGITSEDVNWDVDDNIKHHVANGSGGRHRDPWKKFGFDPDDPKFFSAILPFLKQVIDEGTKYNEVSVAEGKVMYYSKYFAEKGYEIIVKIFENPEGAKVLSDAYINTR